MRRKFYWSTLVEQVVKISIRESKGTGFPLGPRWKTSAESYVSFRVYEILKFWKKIPIFLNS